MARIHIGTDGIIIAKPGYSHTAAQQYLNFSNRAVTMAIYMSGTVALGSPVDVGAPAAFGDVYRKGVVNFGKTFSVPPIVLFCGRASTGDKIYVPSKGFYRTAVPAQAWEPAIFGVVTTTNFTFWTAQANISSGAYIVLENTLS